MKIALDTAGIHRLWSQAEASLALGDLVQARLAYEALAGQVAVDSAVRMRLSMIATRQGRYRDSVAQLLAVSDALPDDPSLLVLVAGILHRFGETRAALACLRHPVLISANDPDLLEESASVASQIEDFSLANALLDAAQRRAAPSASSLYLRGTFALFDGRLDDAERDLEASLTLPGANAQPQWALSRLRRQTVGHNHVGRLRRSLDSAQDDGNRAFLGFGLFKELDDLGRYDEAWPALMAGCAAKRRQLAYRSADDAPAFGALMALNPAPDAPIDSAIAPGPQPIFIVGLPRTGTTVLERMLGRHTEVSNAGELADFVLQLRWCADRFAKSHLSPAVTERAAAIDVAQLGRRYLDHAQWRADGKAFFTDKMPLNYLHVGFIARALPQARILHMVRNPMDSCLSNLTELFTDAYPYSYDLDDLATHYGRYRRLMAHWHATLPGRILDVSYESLVSDPAGSARRVLDFCGLDWQPGCIDIESNTMPVTTASTAQVRQPIHTRSIDSWRRYAERLEPLRRRLQADGWVDA